MVKIPTYLKHSLVTKLIFAVGVTLVISISAWTFYFIRHQTKREMDNILKSTERLAKTIKQGTHYAMMHNSRDEITQIIKNISGQRDITHIRIYNKAGQIKYSSSSDEIDRMTNIKAEACDICHRSDPPLDSLNLRERTRIFYTANGNRQLGIIDPIYNRPGCSSSCHFHPGDKKILGALELVVSLSFTDQEIRSSEQGILVFACAFFLAEALIILFFVHRFFNRPIQKLIKGTRYIAEGKYDCNIDIGQEYELGQLANAINLMGLEIGRKQKELNEQRDEYQALFDRAPCMITVQDREFRLLRFNRAFEENFNPEPGAFCYKAYKGRDSKCVNCPVEKTFKDGKSHYGEESGIDRNGEPSHWIFITAPIRNTEGEVVSAMEMSLDITPRRQLEEKLEASEAKYYAIFDNIPNPVFVLDRKTLVVIDCNRNVFPVYGMKREEIQGKSITDLFPEGEGDGFSQRVSRETVMNRVRHRKKDGTPVIVDLWISRSEFSGEKVYIVITSDITKRLKTENQLMQAGKLATLGEMSTGVAHELNQPLSVIKTAGTFILKKLRLNEDLSDEILGSMMEKIDRNVDRASKIITHMRQFARKTEMDLGVVQVNSIMERALDIFSQQLKVRGIEIICDLKTPLPEIKADPGRLEQVFINLLINARDAVETRWEQIDRRDERNRIYIKTDSHNDRVTVSVKDVGAGISEKIKDKLFEPFFTTKEVGKGTGLGLSISYGIVRECGGTIKVVSMEGEGAEFILDFPAV